MILAFKFCILAIGHRNVGVLEDIKVGGNLVQIYRNSHAANTSAWKIKIVISRKWLLFASGKFNCGQFKEANYKEFAKFTIPKAIPATPDIPTLTYSTTKLTPDGQNNTFGMELTFYRKQFFIGMEVNYIYM